MSENEDILLVRNMGLEVDEDNDPIPKNVPEENDTNGEEDPLQKNNQGWGCNGIDEREKVGVENNEPKIMHGMDEIAWGNISFLSMFKLFFPYCLCDIVIQATNKSLQAVDEKPISHSEFLRWIGLWLYMSTLSGFTRKEYWSLLPVSPHRGAPYRFNNWMSLRRFELIHSHLSFTTNEPPPYKDRLWEVRQIIGRWNTNMKKIFKPSWVSCVDESMSIWFNRWTCPAWIFVPRKPHPFGMEYNDIGCGLCNIIYGILLREGKDEPKELLKNPLDEKGKVSTVCYTSLTFRETYHLFVIADSRTITPFV